MIREHRDEVRTGGIFGETTFKYEWQAVLFTPTGEPTLLWQAPWDGIARGGIDSDGPRGRELRALIAELGRDGWEPIPLVIVGGGKYTSSNVEWYFKRQLSDS